MNLENGKWKHFHVQTEVYWSLESINNLGKEEIFSKSIQLFCALACLRLKLVSCAWRCVLGRFKALKDIIFGFTINILDELRRKKQGELLILWRVSFTIKERRVRNFRPYLVVEKCFEFYFPNLCMCIYKTCIVVEHENLRFEDKYWKIWYGFEIVLYIFLFFITK